MLSESSEAKHLLANPADAFPSAPPRARRCAPRHMPLGMTPLCFVCRLSSTDGELLLHAQERAAGGVDRYPESGFARTTAVADVPDEHVFAGVPVEQVGDRLVGMLLQDFVSAVLLGDFVGLRGVNFEKVDVKDQRAAIGGTVGVLGAGGDAGLRRAFGTRARPHERLNRAASGGGETGSPYRSLSVLTRGVGGRFRLQAEGAGVRRPAVRGDVKPLEGFAPGMELGCRLFFFGGRAGLGARLLLLRWCAGLAAGQGEEDRQCKNQNKVELSHQQPLWQLAVSTQQSAFSQCNHRRRGTCRI